MPLILTVSVIYRNIEYQHFYVMPSPSLWLHLAIGYLRFARILAIGIFCFIAISTTRYFQGYANQIQI